ncbi:hypothetical protein KFL_002750080 [Klebsormidium nitens]|uniref:Uncharacterized protein n=1 Tax=Klebsormidium nitens TaxID=105231 RepID=A0A1Y1IAP2_KLENI|nr:hypothetical protein KFL_002750080 [Klebsormidium nitens]|eukprot:GAQ86191.1 hypothetical protein KFL_002750080 [Klebsormidium nitens]
MKSHVAGRPQRSSEELVYRMEELMEELALCVGGSGYIWLVVKGGGGHLGGCSPNLKPYKAALADEVEKATERPVVVALEGDPPRLPRTESVLLALAKTRHVELHPIVAMMIQGFNEINNHKVPRVKALADPSTIPSWFPLSAEAYASRSQKMDLHQLFSVLDSIFHEVRGNLRSIQGLHSMLDRAYKNGSCSISTRAGMDSFFHFLEEEALSRVKGPPSNGDVRGDIMAAEDRGVGHGFDNMLSAFGKYNEQPVRRGGELECYGMPPLLANAFQPVASYANGVPPEMILDQKNPRLARGLPRLQSNPALSALETTGGLVNGVVANGLLSNGGESDGALLQEAQTEEMGFAERASEAVEKCAQQKGGKEFVWIVVTEKDGTLGGCSQQLTPYGPALMDQVERAAREPINFPTDAANALPKIADVLRPLSGVRHIDLQPIIAALINGMDDVTSQKGSRKRARKDPSQVPAWFPLPAEKYAGRLQSLDLSECFLIIDAIFGHVRGQLGAIAKLRGSLDRFFAENPACPTGTRAAIDGFLDFLEADAGVPRGSATGLPRGNEGARRILHRRSAFTPCKKEEVTEGADQGASVKMEVVESDVKAVEEPETGVLAGKERTRSNEQATGSGRAEGEEASVDRPDSAAALEKAEQGGEVEAGSDRGEQPIEGSDSGKENLDEAAGDPLVATGGDATGSGVEESKPLEALAGRGRKRSRREGTIQARSKMPRDASGAGKTIPVYKPLPEKTPQAYGRMLSLFEALDTSSGGPSIG